MSDQLPLAFIKYLDNRFDKLEVKIDGSLGDHNERISSLESTRSEQRGAAKLTIAAASAIAGVISLLFAWLKG
jgi:hypothetical protein